MNCVHLIIWVFGMQNALNIAMTRFAGAIIVVQVALMKVQELTGIVVIMKISFQNVQRLPKKLKYKKQTNSLVWKISVY